MKKILIFPLILSLLLCGCGSTQQFKKPLKFYYPVKNVDYSIGSSYLQPEIREGNVWGSDIVSILNAYLSGPADPATYSMPFQYNTQIHSISQTGGILNITLTRSFATYTGLRLTIACACLTLTVLELTDAQTVRIRAHGTSLDGAEYIEMNAATILLLDLGNAEQE